MSGVKGMTFHYNPFACARCGEMTQRTASAQKWAAQTPSRTSKPRISAATG